MYIYAYRPIKASRLSDMLAAINIYQLCLLAQLALQKQYNLIK
jgi:hypothetical protein